MNDQCTIIKSGQINITGTHKLTVSTHTSKPSGQPAGAAGQPGNPQAAVVEQNKTYAIIEITCQCGQTNRIKCMYENKTEINH